MGDLATDTAVTTVDEGRFTADLSPDWEIWGPNGGYLASVAMRAAQRLAGRARPASISAHFVGAGRSGPVDIRVETNRSTKVATSLTVSVSQEDRPWLVATVWGVDDDLPGLEHQASSGVAAYPPPADLASVADLMPDDAPRPHAFWSNLDTRPLTWISDWHDREPSEPTVTSWYRFQPAATFDDPWVDACRSLILIDLEGWPAAGRPHVGDLDVYAPTIEVTARFIGDTRAEPWLLSQAEAPAAANGLIGGRGQIYDSQRRLVALGGSTMLCRPAVRRPDR